MQNFKKVATIGGLVSLSLLPGRAVLSQSPASFSGAVVYTAPSGAVTSLSAEIALPPGLYFNGNPTVTYNSLGTAGTNGFRPTALILQPDSIVGNPVLTPATQIANNLSQITNLTTNEQNLAAYVSIVRAAAGAGGLD